MKPTSRVAGGSFFFLLALFVIAIRGYFLVRDYLDEAHGDPLKALVLSLPLLAAAGTLCVLILGGLALFAHTMKILRDDVLSADPELTAFTVQATDDVSYGLKSLYPELFTGRLRDTIGRNFVVGRGDDGISFWKRVGPLATRRVTVPWDRVLSVEIGRASFSSLIPNRRAIILTVIGEKYPIALNLMLRDSAKFWYPTASVGQLEAAARSLAEPLKSSEP